MRKSETGESVIRPLPAVMLASPSYPRPAQTCHSKLPPRTGQQPPPSLPVVYLHLVSCAHKFGGRSGSLPPDKNTTVCHPPVVPRCTGRAPPSLRLSSRSSGLISTATAGRMMQNVPDKILHEPRACSQNLIGERIRVTNADMLDARRGIPYCGRHCSKGSKQSSHT